MRLVTCSWTCLRNSSSSSSACLLFSASMCSSVSLSKSYKHMHVVYTITDIAASKLLLRDCRQASFNSLLFSQVMHGLILSFIIKAAWDQENVSQDQLWTWSPNDRNSRTVTPCNSVLFLELDRIQKPLVTGLFFVVDFTMLWSYTEILIFMLIDLPP